ncbi:hypothetical protein [Lysinibacter cavernae]|uniref:DUF2975 domain-containing protein n=1 Tax=Lysinibacter cavernae TaxID=1640652 RepID=A0A7X5TVC1_9MICO|nr:hypothetical protein [Lysinibacter cavernae]NIH54742.1 hypothetical protein [Lysinibacter cavernae]
MSVTREMKQIRRDQIGLLMLCVGCTVGGVIVFASLLTSFIIRIVNGTVDIVADFGLEFAEVTAPNGVTFSPTGVTQTVVAAGDLPAGALVLLRAGEASAMVLWPAVIMLIGMFAWYIGKGRAFGRQSQRTLSWIAALVLALMAVPGFLNLMGTNWALSSVGWGSYPDPRSYSGDYWVIYLALLFCVCVQIGFRTGARLDRDQEGII